ncbi:unnamed protein product [Prorocentrum cordatum]|uniref:H(+)-exporting diphosphatase n=1 Tax=Prorocentrum cordatum TaxID=2364126 RepID=A0ABN9TKX8_9DINO|nr:unnamed protein product [Polarella glacialis]
MASSLVTAVFTLLFDVAVLVVGLLVWWALRGQGSFDDKPRPLESITEKAYILFLRTCRDMCLTLTAVSAAMLVPYFRLSDFQVELNLPITGNFSAARLPEHSSDICAQPSLHATGRVNHHDGGAGCSLLCEELDLPMRDIFQCAMMCIMTVVNGGVALAFLQRFQRQVQMFDYLDAEGTSPGPNGHRDRDDMDRIGRTLWFTELPTADRQTGRAWLLDEEGFQRVEADIARELETHLHGAPAPTPRFSPIEEIPLASRRRPHAGGRAGAPHRDGAGRQVSGYAKELAKEQESAVRREAPLTDGKGGGRSGGPACPSAGTSAAARPTGTGRVRCTRSCRSWWKQRSRCAVPRSSRSRTFRARGTSTAGEARLLRSAQGSLLQLRPPSLRLGDAPVHARSSPLGPDLDSSASAGAYSQQQRSRGEARGRPPPTGVSATFVGQPGDEHDHCQHAWLSESCISSGSGPIS